MTEGSMLDVATTVAVYLGILAIGVPIVWAVSEAIGKATKRNELKVALLMGPAFAVLMLFLGWLPVLPTIFTAKTDGDPVDIVINVIFAIVTGLAQTFGAKKLNDKVLKPRGIKLPTRI